ncbi:phospholipid carrier-dependent glycosyltransferase [Phormidium sp. CLA17]|uniref:dolichyl-phosphate-mannose--protein mannosyltransferase n=1 Tax=Leptolyngbya sp. Cla-17 TaxID=2803751 RepID=UPI0014930F65|nr:phospholipid carrier-dependent glycosyltransferase [Leptolyngbya sp. Cla-17]MBM0742204.1 phospholipid carrier-dependent glycosyltransferase [Leptolyngbya sp. Cla-17]
MALFKTTNQSFSWFRPYLIGLLLLSLGLRFWGIHRFNTLVFDEVYFAKFAYNYLSWTPFFDGHPPLSKYLIAVGMWVGSRLPFGQSEVNGLVGGLFAPWTYRWLNALTGSLIPLVIVGLAYQITHRHRYAAITGLFAALDGLFLVESRYALNNVYLVIFGLLGLWCLLLSVEDGHPLKRGGWLLLSGICFGASASVKWNGLWFLLAAYGLGLAAQVNWQLFRRSPAQTSNFPPSTASPKPDGLENLARLRRWQGVIYLIALIVVPCITYILIWIPHLQLNAKLGFWTDLWNLQVEILRYHERVGSGPKVHLYCSTWYSWLIMWRPVAYFYKITGKGDPLPSEVALPPSTAEKVIYDVHAMGNPFLWWFSTAAIAIVLVLMGWLLVQQIATRRKRRLDHQAQTDWMLPLAVSSTERSLLIVLAVCYLANLLPWLRVTRCLFIYHYMGASVFASMALAWLVDRWLSSRQAQLRQLSIAIIAIVTLSFLFWLPVYLGLPLSSLGFSLRMWLRSWV